MLGSIIKGWYLSGVSATLSTSGLTKKEARQVTVQIQKNVWKLIFDCTKDLNSQCKNLCNSLFSLMLFEFLHDDKIIGDFILRLEAVNINLKCAIEYQCEMGHRNEIEESKRRFEYVCEMFLSQISIKNEKQKDLIVTQNRKDSIKNIRRISEASRIIHDLLREQVKYGLFTSDPGERSDSLILSVWAAKPDLFNENSLRKPSEMSIAVTALFFAIEELATDHDNYPSLIIALGTLIETWESNKRLYTKNSLDSELFTKAIIFFKGG